MDRTDNLQRGIAIAPILFVVAILAVLAMAIAAGSGAFNGDTSAVKAKAQATAILEYANEVKFAIDRLLAKGCKDTEISFENPFVSGYTNPNAPSDKSCHVFDVDGGGIVWKDPPKEVVYDTNYGKWQFKTGTTNYVSFRELGTEQHDLFLTITGTITHGNAVVEEKGRNLLAVCQEINKMLGVGSGTGVGNLPRSPSTGPFHILFTGFYNESTGAYGTGPPGSVPEPAMWGKTTFCTAWAGTDFFSFLKVLIVR